ncbi:MAG: sensor histidine kinase [Aquaticitalea sp.]
MKSPKIPSNETDRLKALNSYHILDTLPEKEYDDITFLASMICGTPISLISLIDKDRQWFKSNHGLGSSETPREFAFCAHAINEKDTTFVVNDARLDERFHDNPLVTSDPNLVFYAGVPLVNPEGQALGTLCVLDLKPNKLNSDQEKGLEILSSQLVKLLELRKNTILLHQNNRTLAKKNKTLDRFVSVAAHDIKAPINNILSLSSMLLGDQISSLNPESVELIDYIQTSAQHSTHLIDGILNYTKGANGVSDLKEQVNLKNLLSEIQELWARSENIKITLNVPHNLYIYSNRTALIQIFSNLISNSIKYNHQDTIKIDITIIESSKYVRVRVEDNGSGIKPEDTKRIFKLFTTTTNKDKDGFHGTGIGLATVKNLIKGLGGKISVSSQQNVGSLFKFNILKEQKEEYA